MKLTLTFAALLLTAFLAWLLWPAPPPPPLRLPPAASLPSKIENPKPKIPPPPPGISHLADQLNSPATDLRRDLQIVADLLDAFRTNFPRAGNPVGANPEITAVLAGQNQLRLVLLAPTHPAINPATGELLDRYGTPFFFHAESGTKMSIRSAGPDKKFHTPDDALLAP